MKEDVHLIMLLVLRRCLEIVFEPWIHFFSLLSKLTAKSSASSVSHKIRCLVNSDRNTGKWECREQSRSPTHEPIKTGVKSTSTRRDDSDEVSLLFFLLLVIISTSYI